MKQTAYYYERRLPGARSAVLECNLSEDAREIVLSALDLLGAALTVGRLNRPLTWRPWEDYE